MSASGYTCAAKLDGGRAAATTSASSPRRCFDHHRRQVDGGLTTDRPSIDRQRNHQVCKAVVMATAADASPRSWVDRAADLRVVDCRDRERQHLRHPAWRSTRAAIVSVHPVSVTSSTSSTGPATADMRREVLTTNHPGPRPGTRSWRPLTGRRRGRYSQRAEIGQPAQLGEAVGQRTDRAGGAARSRAPSRRPAGSGQSQAASTLDRRPEHIGRDLAVRLVEQSSQPRSPAQVGETADDPPGAGPSVIRPLRSMPSLAIPDGHCLRGADLDPGAHQPLAGGLDRRRRRPARRSAAPAQLSQRPQRSPRSSSGSSKLAAQERHPALGGALIVEHRLLFASDGPLRACGSAARRMPRLAACRSSPL